MSLIKRDFPMMANFTDFFDDDWLQARFARDWTPAINVVENEDNYEIEVAAPGMKKKDFNVSIENGVLTVHGRAEKEEEEKGKNFTRREFSTRSFTKSFTLPENVDEEAMKARYDDGILHLTIGKTEKVLPPKKEVHID